MAYLFEDDFCDDEPALTWKRPGRGEGLYDDEDVCLFRNVDPNDVNQGGLGDCWILSSMAALAEFPGSITKLFSPQTLAPDGRYTIRLWSWAEKAWKNIVVDDRLPVDFTGSACKYAKISGCGEIWPCLLEKAFAKYSGGYSKINGGNPAFSLASLTGCPDIIQLVKSKTEDGVWQYFAPKWSSDDVKDGPDTGNPITDEPLQELNENQVMAMIQDADNQNFVLTASKYNTIGRALGNIFCPICMLCVADTDHEGIAFGHAYSLITVLSNAAGTGYNLVCLRNPWGEERVVEWRGDWSDGDDLWRQYPQVKAAAMQTDADDGLFWMEYEDFVEHYDTIAICRSSMGMNRVQQQVHPHRQQVQAQPKKAAGGGSSKAKPKAKHQPARQQQPQPVRPTPQGYPAQPNGYPQPPPNQAYPSGYPPF
mmetsp:Transcript_11281/g.25901  ORF Transcript_11281/g.25901 Transcript_11281/m.25901 type:complete len:423 (-) Transcript_11281:120-1388(-)